MGRAEAEVNLDRLSRLRITRDADLGMGHPAVELEHMRNAQFVCGKRSKNKIFHGLPISKILLFVKLKDDHAVRWDFIDRHILVKPAFGIGLQWIVGGAIHQGCDSVTAGEWSCRPG